METQPKANTNSHPPGLIFILKKDPKASLNERTSGVT